MKFEILISTLPDGIETLVSKKVNLSTRYFRKVGFISCQYRIY